MATKRTPLTDVYAASDLAAIRGYALRKAHRILASDIEGEARRLDRLYGTGAQEFTAALRQAVRTIEAATPATGGQLQLTNRDITSTW